MSYDSLTGQLNWNELNILSGEANAQATGWAAARASLREEEGPVGAVAASALPLSGARRPSERTDPLGKANPQRPTTLDPVSNRYTHFEDELVFELEVWQKMLAEGAVPELVDDCYEAIHSRLLASLTNIYQNADNMNILAVRGGDNALEPLASAAHARIDGGTEDNRNTLAFSAANVRTQQSLLASQNKIIGEPGYFRPRYVIWGDKGALDVVTGSPFASSAYDINTGQGLIPIHLPGLTTHWVLSAGPKPGGLMIEYARGRRPYVMPPFANNYGTVKIVFGVKFAFLCPSYHGLNFSAP